METIIRPAETPADYDAIWQMWQEVMAQREYYPYDETYDRAAIEATWINRDNVCVVAERGSQVVGAYILRPNQPGYGNHIANAAYMVNTAQRGHGIGKLLGAHSIAMARASGYLAMQFNLVLSTNVSAVRAWLANGFEIIGTVPEAFRHHRLGLVSAHIMYRDLY